ncbi:hypothetical protein PG987_006966 [Apiospora arundinis]
MEETQCAQAPKDSPVVDIDPDGDLLLKVGLLTCIPPEEPAKEPAQEPGKEPENEPENEQGEGQEGKEAEASEDADKKHDHTLASPVWKKMLFGGFSESKRKSKRKDGDWIVKLPDDDVEAMEFFLDTIHARFDRVPTFDHIPALEDLYQIAVVADKYDINRFLRPWAKAWAPHIKDNIENRQGLEHYLWISWVIGADEEFKRITHRLGMEYKKMDEEEVRTLMPDILEPPGAMSLIKDIRLALIAEALSPLREAFHQLSHIGLEDRKLIRSLNRCSLWPIPDANDVVMSVNDLADILSNVGLKTERYVHFRDYSCQQVFAQPVTRQWFRDRVQVQLSDYQKSQIEEHRKATGLYRGDEEQEPAKKKTKRSR